MSTGSRILSGAGTGAMAGGAAGGPWGAAAGALGGGLFGLFVGISEEEDADNRRQALRDLADSLGKSYDEILKDYQDFYQKYQPAGKMEDAELAADAIRHWDSSKYDWMASYDKNGDGKVSADEYDLDYDKTVDSFMNPYADEILKRTGKIARESAGGALLGRSTGATDAMMRAMMKEEDELYNTALKAYESDRDFAYRKWSDYNTAMEQRLKGLMQADQWQIGQMQQLGQDALSWQAQGFQAMQDAKQNKLNTTAQLNAAAEQI
jgi:hypothetical protein